MNEQLIPVCEGPAHHAGRREILEAFHRLQQHFGEEIGLTRRL
jgi:hypothetical protein